MMGKAVDLLHDKAVSTRIRADAFDSLSRKQRVLVCFDVSQL